MYGVTPRKFDFKLPSNNAYIWFLSLYPPGSFCGKAALNQHVKQKAQKVKIVKSVRIMFVAAAIY